MVNPVGSITSLVGGVNAVGGTAAPAAPSAASAPGSDFGTVLANMSSDAIGTLKAGEATAISGLEGRAAVQDVVSAVMAAEQTLQAALAIRDKVVQAYQELARMQI
ncbi:flagellar hook-basal body complex protein FliE [Afifella sp. IM 167]|uniref:flagellar hook-basal body complex protein FliE n=1 Tax=Afifella sp. IM 167 TaxID=2033586 RepID=UPI001CCD55A5|nr:flagellar hook-basal body complex protein FliE [Afifella sp. IM 167]MBZ8131784.1 flagellar hook-basal body protein FliE [Afifella sp. IM 167]